MIENLEMIISFVATLVSFMSALIVYIVKYVKSVKSRIRANNEIKVYDTLISLVEEAERYTNFTGSEKKTYVLTRILKFMTDNKIELSFEDIEGKIEDYITLSKKVNVKIGVKSNSSDKELKEV